MAAGAALLAGLALGATPAAADSLGSPARISESGERSAVGVPSVAYGQASYLSVWADEGGASAILGRLVSADGAAAGDAVELSLPSERVWNPVVTYNATAGEYLVVWQQATGSAEVQECWLASAIMGRRVSAAGVPLGEPFAITPASGCAIEPDVSWSSTDDRYLVAWSDRMRGVVRGRVLDGAGAPLTDPFAIALPPDEWVSADEAPAIAHDRAANRWLVVWHDGDGGIAGQLVGPDGARVGDPGLVAEPWNAHDPDVAFNATAKEFLVTYAEWVGPSSLAAAVEPDRVVAGQRLDQSGAPIGATGFRISDARFFHASDPSVAWDPQGDRYTVVYAGATPGDPPAPSVFGQTLAADGTPVGTAGFAVAERDGDRNPRGLAYNPDRCEFLAAWEGDEGDRTEIAARRIAGTACPPPEQPPVIAPPPGTATPSGEPPVTAPDSRRPQIAVKGARAFGGACSGATSVRLRVRARDASAVRVNVFVAGKRVRSTSRTRFTVVLSTGSLAAGRHVVRVVARDAAGNRSVRRITVRRCRPRVVLPRFAG
jgi:hypothetical protein